MPASKAPSTAKKHFPKRTPESDTGKSPSELIDQRIGELPDWRGDMLTRLRAVIKGADSDINEEWKWNVPVWSCGGIICTGETYKKVVKLTFAKGAFLADPSRLFNSSLDGGTRRAIDFTDRTSIKELELRAFVQAAIRQNKLTLTARGKNPA